MNKGGKSFKLEWQEVRYRARGVSACDFDQDGDLDVYVSNYRLQPNILWQNDGKGNLTDITGAFGALANGHGFGGGHSIGAAWGDFDNDGNIDLFAGNFAHKDSRGNQPESVWLRNTGKENQYKFENKGQGGVFYQESFIRSLILALLLQTMIMIVILTFSSLLFLASPPLAEKIIRPSFATKEISNL